MTLVQLAALYGKSPALESLGQDAKLELPKPVFALLGVHRSRMPLNTLMQHRLCASGGFFARTREVADKADMALFARFSVKEHVAESSRSVTRRALPPPHFLKGSRGNYLSLSKLSIWLWDTNGSEDFRQWAARYLA